MPINLARSIDLERSLRAVYSSSEQSGVEAQIKSDCQRQEQTTREILYRFSGADERRRRELVILADEVGLGKTYVALAVAVSMLAAIRDGVSGVPDDIPVNRPCVLVLTPINDALFQKWGREAHTFVRNCATKDGDLDWLEIVTPRDGKSNGSLVDLTKAIRGATRSRPRLIISKLSVLGQGIDDRNDWRKRALAALFRVHANHADQAVRRRWSRVVDGARHELADLRGTASLWDDTQDYSPDLKAAFSAAAEKINFDHYALGDTRFLDDLVRAALASDWPKLPLVIIDEVHGLKNKKTQARKRVEEYLGDKVSRILGLSATPFQLRHDELISVLELSQCLSLPPVRFRALEDARADLATTLEAARESGSQFRGQWRHLQADDQAVVSSVGAKMAAAPVTDWANLAATAHPARVARALQLAAPLGRANQALEKDLGRFVIRHQHRRDYRSYRVGRDAHPEAQHSSAHFAWAPGLEVDGDAELVQYLFMRTVALAKDEKGLPPLGAELNGSYRHLINTSKVWSWLQRAGDRNPLLPRYRAVLARILGPVDRAEGDIDDAHRKISATVGRVLAAFRTGHKSLVFCVNVETADALKRQIDARLQSYLEDQFAASRLEDAKKIDSFRRRFFNRHEPLYDLIQDHVLLTLQADDSATLPPALRLGEAQLTTLANLLAEQGGSVADIDYRMLLACVEHVAVRYWQSLEGVEPDWRRQLASTQAELWEAISSRDWLAGRHKLLRLVGRNDPEATHVPDPLPEDDELQPVRGKKQLPSSALEWQRHLSTQIASGYLSRYFQAGIIKYQREYPPLLAYHAATLSKLTLNMRRLAGQVFRRMIMAEEFLGRYLLTPDVGKHQWVTQLASQYQRRQLEQAESLYDRVEQYLETLRRAQGIEVLAQGYEDAARNKNLVQLVKGATRERSRYFLGFNTPYRPEILVSTSVGEEGIDLHRECRHVIHHDLCWNPATIEQRTGRVDRIGSKVERERAAAGAAAGPRLEISVPYLAATYDERMFQQLHRRAQLFDVTMGGDFHVDGRDPVDDRKEDWGSEDELTLAVDIPDPLIQRLRVDLSVYGRSEAE